MSAKPIVGVRVDPEMLEGLRKVAKRNRKSLSTYLRTVYAWLLTDPVTIEQPGIRVKKPKTPKETDNGR